MKHLTNIDLNQNQLINAVIQKLATAPANPVAGQVYYDTAKKRLFYYNGTKWEGSDALDAVMNGTDIINAINSSSSTISDARLSQAVRDAVAKAHNTHSIGDVDGLQIALDGKVDDSQVLTNVPTGAKFTDTVTTVNGKTGVITKADIVSLGIPAQDTTYSVFNTTTNGLTPKSDGSSNKYLRADGTWVIPPDTKYTLPVAGATLGGVKSGTDITVDASGNVSINDNSHAHTVANVTGLQAVLDGLATKAVAQGYATTAEGNAKTYTDTAINNLIGDAPAVLDTLHEIADALNDDPNFVTTITSMIGLKTDKYSKAIGDGTATSIVVTHNLGTRDLAVSLRETASPYAMVMTDVEFTTENTVTVKFAKAPTLNEYTVTVVG